MNEFKKYTFEWGGRPLVIESGEYAKQANAAVMITYGDSAVLTAVCSKNEASTQDFFPLMVLYTEKLYAAGKIPGGFLRREGRPSENETLTSRLIDRPIRPLFADGFRNEVQIVNTVMSSDPDASPEMAAMFGSSLALMLSDIPFEGPIAGVIVGRVDGKFVINPTPAQLEVSDIELTVAGTSTAINMVEAGAKQVSEEVMLEALKFGHAEIVKLCEIQNKIAKEIGKEKIDVKLFVADPVIDKEVRDFAEADLVKAIQIVDKLERYAAIDAVNDKTVAHFDEKVFVKEVGDLKVIDTEAKKAYINQVNHTLHEVLYEEVRRLISVDKVRPDGRKVDEIRPLHSRVDVLPRPHGSAMFTRGQTQSLSFTTLGALNEHQIIDGLAPETQYKRFMLHYNFPQYSVGETGRYGATGRREVGHGALGERAILQVMPSEEEFPYSVRVVSEVIESNGSTSQASICAGVLSLMAAGVPLKATVAGIAMGLVTKGDDYTILTDIQGMEDHLGDMDFKVAGTKDGITALQMDIKIKGLTFEIIAESLAQAKKGRLELLTHMESVIPAPREQVSKYAPKVKLMTIKPEKIKDVIGSGGKVITKIIESCNSVKIDIEQDGKVCIMHSEYEWLNKAAAMIEGIVREAEIGAIYTGTVKRIEAFGAFVEIFDGCDGLVHISKLAKERVANVADVVKIGDKIVVKCIGVDEKGRVDLSRKDALEA
ncbi:MAG: polyribonucleotide nucleotidyltransferase [bacterium]